MNKNKYRNRVRELREKRGLKQVELASMAGVGITTVNRIELWHFHVAPMTAQRLADALGCEIGEAFPFIINEQEKRR